jgi:hypothetical protein
MKVGEPSMMRSPLKQPKVEVRSKLLLISVVSFFVLAPILESIRMGGLLLVLTLYLTLVTAVMEVSVKRSAFFATMPVAVISMVLLMVTHLRPDRTLLLCSHIFLTLFFIIVSVSLFTYLGRRETITAGRIHVSVALYFLLGLTWFSGYELINLIQPGSFAEAGVALTGEVHWSTLLYFSLTTLTTLGYGDVVAIKPPARMFATLEASAGVLYIAITVARLVASYQSSFEQHE